MAPSGTVLLVNSFDGREMYADHLRANALIVRDADSPEAALRALDATDPHVVVTDVMFPRSGVDGADFLRALRARVDGATSIIVVSAFVRQERERDAENIDVLRRKSAGGLIDLVRRAAQASADDLFTEQLAGERA